MRRLNSLDKLIRKHIQDHGPIALADYMSLCLVHPTLGYYMRGASVGKDFITAPEISQMFGELVGIWALSVWQSMDHPPVLNLIELGPGRGTMMADLLRATAKWDDFHKAIRIHFVEASPSLQRMQEAMIHPKTALWHDDPESLPQGPCIILANEFFDALPIRQLVKTAAGWCERKIDWNEQDESFFFVADTTPSAFEILVPESLKGAAEGEIFEVSPLSLSLMHFIGDHIAKNTGAALIIDYGKTHSSLGSTFQALRLHQKVNVLEDCGEADLTAFVDFDLFTKTLRPLPCEIYGPVPQGDFLENMGIRFRAKTLERKGVREEIERSLTRLTAPEEMGELFKVLAVTSLGIPMPPGFDGLTHG